MKSRASGSRKASLTKPSGPTTIERVTRPFQEFSESEAAGGVLLLAALALAWANSPWAENYSTLWEHKVTIGFEGLADSGKDSGQKPRRHLETEETVRYSDTDKPKGSETQLRLNLTPPRQISTLPAVLALFDLGVFENRDTILVSSGHGGSLFLWSHGTHLFCTPCRR
jgi:Na+/H+ antiporter 1